MNKFLATCLLFLSFSVLADEQMAMVNELLPILKNWGQDPVLVSAVKEQNLQNKSLDSIKVRDAEWRLFDGVDEQMKSLMSNTAALRLMELEKTQAFYFELFLMDNQGANVAMTNKTSDYWQGDEAKWQESFKEGKGAVHVGEVEFDESAQDYLVQVSVPVIDNGKAIGALTIGINLDVLESK